MAEAQGGKAWTWLVPIVVLAAVFVVLLLWTRGLLPGSADAAASPSAEPTLAAEGTPTSAVPSPTASALAPEEAAPLEAERRDPEDVLAVGPVDAAVVLVVFSDVLSADSAAWANAVLPAVAEQAAAGTVRIEWRDIDVENADAERAARATYAAGAQGKLPEFLAALFAGGDAPAAEALSDAALADVAAAAGLDTRAFATDMASYEASLAVAMNAEQAVELGVTSAPTFSLAGMEVTGDLTADEWVALIAEVAAAG